MKNIDIARLTPETWPARREALVKLFGQEEYGVVPAGWTSSFVWEKELEKDGLHGRLGCVTVEYKGRSMSFPFALWLPEKTSEPVPCAIQISCHDPVVHDQMKGIDPAMREKFMGMMKELIGNEDHFNVMIDDMMAPKEPNTLDITCDVEKGYWPVRQLLADGYAAAAIYASSLAPDEGDSWKQEGLYPLFYGAGERPADGFGCLTAWGFGAQRVLDALLTCPEIDPKRISVAGHSRAGKAALWAAVQDERFATVLANNSGCCGVAMNVGKLGERVASMCQMMPRWFCKNFLKYSAMPVEQMPFDQDELLAAMAPRPVFVTSGNRDYWSDPEAEFRSVISVGRVYAALGKTPCTQTEYPAPQTAWGFGAQRVLDALLTCPEIDPKRISVAGHSRAGKAALWAAVQDERFATVLANNSGCCGVAMNVGKLGERVASMCQMMPRWFCKNFLKYSAMPVEQMPFDQDELLAAMAPRPVFVTSGNRDYWSDPEAEFRSVISVGRVYAALGKTPCTQTEYPAPQTACCTGDVGYALREGPHDMTAWDWKQFCNFEAAQAAKD